MANWHPLSIGSPLNGMPSALSSAPVIGKLELLPFDSLSWEDFERLQWRVMRDVEGLRPVSYTHLTLPTSDLV